MNLRRETLFCGEIGEFFRKWRAPTPMSLLLRAFRGFLVARGRYSLVIAFAAGCAASVVDVGLEGPLSIQRPKFDRNSLCME